ncbi:hypothetical protein D5E87_24450 [Vibrio parahaemolyticus]|nr:hypothetical protein FDV78_02725 [Vibrio parahaemolyticus]TBT02158.1 hypothetical protein D5E87_24450 [Vibrio parahaemolyticus]
MCKIHQWLVKNTNLRTAKPERRNASGFIFIYKS